ncbi:MAG: hypothetical protein WBJ54_07615 [Syntrophorhabdus sp.]|nr:hypothetical protein [Syntrophorhabdus sp.]MDI9557821.1 hypothetical protein [Pseudomonadota bacterium]MBP8745444.1 hypothetical protein [Syntrophorhabdus sp.]HNS79219.1 hypothetical protein [Syntrophorhabdus sp.]HOD79374.1 hypothetical protein [Syntrophorhabdus sp.]
MRGKEKGLVSKPGAVKLAGLQAEWETIRERLKEPIIFTTYNIGNTMFERDYLL